jgi:hypothetical protein
VVEPEKNMKTIPLYFAIFFCAHMLLRECRRRASSAPIHAGRKDTRRFPWLGCATVDAVLFLFLFCAAAVLTTVRVRVALADQLIAANPQEQTTKHTKYTKGK